MLRESRPKKFNGDFCFYLLRSVRLIGTIHKRKHWGQRDTYQSRSLALSRNSEISLRKTVRSHVRHFLCVICNKLALLAQRRGLEWTLLLRLIFCRMLSIWIASTCITRLLPGLHMRDFSVLYFTCISISGIHIPCAH
jgi:hypothetical protein